MSESKTWLQYQVKFSSHVGEEIIQGYGYQDLRAISKSTYPSGRGGRASQ